MVAQGRITSSRPFLLQARAFVRSGLANMSSLMLPHRRQGRSPRALSLLRERRHR
jgi:hypothetical protein